MTQLRLSDAGVRAGSTWLLRHVDLEAIAGEVLCVVGPNGAGKSTLLRCLVGMLAPHEGTATLDGKRLESFSRREVARQVAFVPQALRPSFGFTVLETVLMGRYPHLGRLQRPQDEDRGLALDALARTDLEGFADRRVTTLSGGELQRCLVARCLASQARTLVLDEPTSSLDLAHALQVMALTRQLAQEGHAVVVALHDLNAAARHADRVAVLGDGRLSAIDDPDNALTPERIERVFGVRVEILTTSKGQSVLVFERA